MMTIIKNLSKIAKRFVFLIALALSCVFLFSSCSIVKSTEQTTTCVDDIYGNSVCIPQPLNRVVANNVSILSYVCALEQADKVCGVADGYKNEIMYENIMPNWKEIPHVAYGKKLYKEELLKTDAQLAILPERYKDTVQQFDEVNISTIVAMPEVESISSVKDTCLRIAKIFNVNDRANLLVEKYQAIIDKYSNLVKNATTQPKVLFMGMDNFTAYHKGMIQDEIITLAGGINALSSIDGDFVEGKTANIDPETIIKSNPDQIWVPSYCNYSAEDFINNSSLSNVNAVKHKQVYTFPSSIDPWDYPTLSSCLGVGWAATKLHPELVSDDNIFEEAANYYQFVFGLDLLKLS